MSDDSFHYLQTVDADALAPVLASWRAAYPDCAVLALLAEADKAAVPVLQAECQRGGLPLLGGIFPALILADRFVGRGVWLIRMTHRPHHALIGQLNDDGAGAAGKIAAAMEPAIKPLLQNHSGEAAPTLFLMFDSLIPNIASILDDLYLETGDLVNYLGVNAGSETFQPMPCLFDSVHLIGDGVLCLLLPADVVSALCHGYQAPEEPITATATVGNRISSINWCPAFEVYKAQVQATYGIALDEENFYRYGAHFPLGIPLANGQTLVRIPVALGENGAITCVGEIPENSLLTLLQAPKPDSLDTVNSLAARLGKRGAPRQLLLFYCAGRRMHLGDAAADELAALTRATGGFTAGALSLGEIGGLEDWAYPLFHNAALVCAVWDQA